MENPTGIDFIESLNAKTVSVVNGILGVVDDDGVLHMLDSNPIDMNTASSEEIFERLINRIHNEHIFSCHGVQFQAIDWRHSFKNIQSKHFQAEKNGCTYDIDFTITYGTKMVWDPCQYSPGTDYYIYTYCHYVGPNSPNNISMLSISIPYSCLPEMKDFLDPGC